MEAYITWRLAVQLIRQGEKKEQRLDSETLEYCRLGCIAVITQRMASRGRKSPCHSLRIKRGKSQPLDTRSLGTAGIEVSYTQLSFICVGEEKRHGYFFHGESPKYKFYLALKFD